MSKTKKKKIRKNLTKKKNLKQIELLDNYDFEFRKLKLKYETSLKNKREKNIMEEYSTQLLLKIDNIETNGIIKIQNYRKRLVHLINYTLNLL
tara:strand:- start:1588 stop:1866 length:279 start_codon:yes stop_codon:yes gene_type:complete